MDGTKQTGDVCIRHFAFETDHADKIVERVRNAGYMKTNPVSPIRVAFVEWHLHESIELFCEKA